MKHSDPHNLLLKQKIPLLINTALKAFYKREIKRLQLALDNLNTQEATLSYWHTLLCEMTRPSEAQFHKLIFRYATYLQAQADGGDLEI